MKWEYPYLQWKPMDTAPKDGTDILAYNKWCDSYKVVSYAYDDLWQADSCPAQEYDLWMPLPPPPQTDTAAPSNTPRTETTSAEDGATRKDALGAAVSPFEWNETLQKMLQDETGKESK